MIYSSELFSWPYFKIMSYIALDNRAMLKKTTRLPKKIPLIDQLNNKQNFVLLAHSLAQQWAFYHHQKSNRRTPNQRRVMVNRLRKVREL